MRRNWRIFYFEYSPIGNAFRGYKNRRIIISNDTPILIQLSIKVDIHRYSGISPLIFSQVLAIGLAIGFRFFESQRQFKGEGTPLNL